MQIEEQHCQLLALAVDLPWKSCYFWRCFNSLVGVKMLKSVEMEIFFPLCFQISAYEDSVAAHLAKILNSDQHSVVISSAK